MCVCMCVVFVSIAHTSHITGKQGLARVSYANVLLCFPPCKTSCYLLPVRVCMCVSVYASLLAHSNECHVLLLKSDLLWTVKGNEAFPCFSVALCRSF